MAPPSTPPSDARPPDLLHTLLQRLRRKQTVQILIAWGALGWAGLQFLSLVFATSERYPLFLMTGLIVYGVGFVVVVLGANFVLRSAHPLRSTLVVAITGVSLLTGFVIRGVWLPTPPGPDDRGAAPTPIDSNSSVRTPQQPAEESPIRRVGDEPSADEPSGDAPSADGGTDAGPSDERSDSVAAPPDPVSEVLDVLAARYGRGDELLVDTQVRREQHQALRRYEVPIHFRFYRYTGGFRLRIGLEATSGETFDDLSDRAAVLRTVIRIPTECGDLPYRIEAVREGEAARIQVELDADEARQAIRDARALERCRL